MEEQQHVDPVTGLLHYRAEEAPVLGLRTAAVLVVEVDGYLLTSQVVGPQAGEVLLVEAAARVRAAASALGGRVRRLAGPHFVVLLPPSTSASSTTWPATWRSSTTVPPPTTPAP